MGFLEFMARFDALTRGNGKVEVAIGGVGILILRPRWYQGREAQEFVWVIPPERFDNIGSEFEQILAEIEREIS